MPSLLSSKFSQILVLAAIFALLFHSRRNAQPRIEEPGAGHTVISSIENSPEQDYLARLVREYGLTNQTEWSAWSVKSTDRSFERNTVTNLAAEFHLNRPKVIDVRTPDRNKLFPQKQLQLPVHGSPLPEQVDASDFLFGITSKVSRVKADDYALVKDWARWLSGKNGNGNGATLVLVLDQATDAQLDHLDEVFAKYGIDAYVTTTTSPMSTARRYFEMIRVMRMFYTTLAQNGQHKKWFGLLDEKVFLPNLSYLQDRLFSYNSNDEIYIGLPSEKTDWAVGDGFVTTFGGGAIFLTLQAVQKIPKLPCFKKDDDSNAFRGKRWDSLLQECLTKNTDLTMKVLPSYYSPLDHNEHATGDSYESGIQPLVLHHYYERHFLNPSLAHLVTDVCGEACFLQRYRFRDNWVLVNGYSITEYPDGLTIGDSNSGRSPKKAGPTILGRVKVDEDHIEKKPLSFKGRRHVWKLMDSAVGKDGAVWQAYVKRGVVDDTPSYKRSASEIMDSVIVLIWETAAASGLKHLPRS